MNEQQIQDLAQQAEDIVWACAADGAVAAEDIADVIRTALSPPANVQQFNLWAVWCKSVDCYVDEDMSLFTTPQGMGQDCANGVSEEYCVESGTRCVVVPATVTVTLPEEQSDGE